jgi:1-aminocyclopropane-1-carboxylate deaminase/D-cysteine desulfhydrase-like pyridoxal-dependent ACC family enzyme
VARSVSVPTHTLTHFPTPTLTHMFSHLPRLHLAHLPTPLEAMPRLSEALAGPRLWIKRDDQTGLATGGNKTRKLEFLMADALAHEADTVITTGAPQSNHCRQTAAAAARHGVGCVLVLTGDDPGEVDGNILLDHLLGARLVFTGQRGREEVMDEIAETERLAKRIPYVIPVGGSVPLGATAYALAMVELQAQMEAAGQRFDRIVFASGSGGTHAGLVAGAGLTGFRGEILGISISQDPAALQSNIAYLATEI